MTYSVAKRLLDILISSVLLILLSPLFLLVGLLIRLESKGSIFYASKRVGQNFRVFPFYKFRSMRIDADQMVHTVAAKNQYGTMKEKAQIKINSEIMLFHDYGWVNEELYLYEQTAHEESAFVKYANDPRITRTGKFIRNTSIDELPQLLNVFLGHMSLVGNRPLPLYEAMKLTTDTAVRRFEAPAGITGLWQVTDRGKKSASAENRKALDNLYVEKMSFFTDCCILIKTPFAALQSETV